MNVSTLWQPSFLDIEAPRIDPSFTDVKRIELGSGAWVDIGRRWLKGHACVFEVLRDRTRWNKHRRQMYDRFVDVPRLTATLPEAGPGHPILSRIVDALRSRYGVEMDSLSLAYYRNGRDSVAMHGDRVKHPQHCLVATVSVGEPRRFLLKPATGGRSRVFSLGWGDLVVMGGTCQATWLHGVPKVSKAGPRISIMFRHSERLADLPISRERPASSSA